MFFLYKFKYQFLLEIHRYQILCFNGIKFESITKLLSQIFIKDWLYNELMWFLLNRTPAACSSSVLLHRGLFVS